MELDRKVRWKGLELRGWDEITIPEICYRNEDGQVRELHRVAVHRATIDAVYLPGARNVEFERGLYDEIDRFFETERGQWILENSTTEPWVSYLRTMTSLSLVIVIFAQLDSRDRVIWELQWQ